MIGLEAVSTLVAIAKNFLGMARDVKDLKPHKAHKEELGLKEDPLAKEFEHLRQQMVYSESENVYWATAPDGRKLGPFCPYCSIKDSQPIPLVRGATRGIYACPFHEQASFTTNEYGARPVRRRRYGWPGRG
jgi:hypothetical protein